MRLHVLQHAAFEGPGEIQRWAEERGHSVTISHLYAGDVLPELESLDTLVVMGGEMNIYQDRDWPWLKAERGFIAGTLASGRRIVGICLGCQFIADALGGRVMQNPEFELGWLPVRWTNEARQKFTGLPEASTVLHWHGDTFNLPQVACRLAASDGCAEQGFVVQGKCLALQFHLEVDPEITAQFVAGQADWPRGGFVQTPEVIRKQAATYCATNRQVLQGLLDAFFKA